MFPISAIQTQLARYKVQRPKKMLPYITKMVTCCYISRQKRKTVPWCSHLPLNRGLSANAAIVGAGPALVLRCVSFVHLAFPLGAATLDAPSALTPSITDIALFRAHVPASRGFSADLARLHGKPPACPPRSSPVSLPSSFACASLTRPPAPTMQAQAFIPDFVRSESHRSNPPAPWHKQPVHADLCRLSARLQPTTS